jgi:hypothetical protein
MGHGMPIGINLSRKIPLKPRLQPLGWKCNSKAALPPAREAEPLGRHSQSETGNETRDNLKAGSRLTFTLS